MFNSRFYTAFKAKIKKSLNLELFVFKQKTLFSAYTCHTIAPLLKILCAQPHYALLCGKSQSH